MRNYIDIILICSFLSCFFSCKDSHKENNTFKRIETTIDINPDLALQMLDSLYSKIDTSGYNKSYYHLLSAEIDSKKNRLNLKNDSLLELSYKYFHSKGLQKEEARILILKGRIWGDLNLYIDALNYYYRALDILDNSNHYASLSQLYDDLGNIYINQGLYNQALLMYKKGYNYDSLCNNKKNMIIALGNIANTYLYLGKPEKYKPILSKAFTIAHNTADSINHICYLDYLLSIYHTEIADYANALHLITKSIDSHHAKDKIYGKYLVKGEILNKLHRLDSVEYYLQKSIQSENIYGKATGYYELHNYYKSIGNLEKALEYVNLYQNEMDSINNVAFDNETQALIYKYNVEKAVMNIRNQNEKILIILVSCFIFVSLILCIISIIRNRKRKLKEIETEAKILETKSEILKKEKDIRNLQDKITAFRTNFEERESEVISNYKEIIGIKENELFLLMKKDLRDQCSSFQKTKISQSIIDLSQQEKNKNIKILTYIQQEDLKKEINKSFKRFVIELKEAFPSLSEDDILLCCLSVLGLSLHTISLCFTVSGTNTIKQRRHRTKTKMLDDNPNSFLINFIFPNKKLNNYSD